MSAWLSLCCEVQAGPLLVPFLQIGLHHLNKVLRGTIAVSWHIHQSKVLSYFEEINLLGMALKRGFWQDEALEWLLKLLL